MLEYSKEAFYSDINNTSTLGIDMCIMKETLRLYAHVTRVWSIVYSHETKKLEHNLFL